MTYSEKEIEIMRSCKTVEEAATKLGRSYKGVYMKAKKLGIELEPRIKRKNAVYVSPAKRKEIYDYFLTHDDNRTRVVAEHFGLPRATVENIINSFLPNF